jgi:hypothetical protein
MATNYTNIFLCKALQNLPKLGFFGLKIKPSGNPVVNVAQQSRFTPHTSKDQAIEKLLLSTCLPGTDVIIKKYIHRKIQRKKLAFLTQNKAKLYKILIITLFF